MNDKIHGFSFHVWEMQLVLRHYVETSAGFRCVAATMKILSGYFEIKSMSYTTVRRWLLCYSYYLLTNPKVKKDGYWVLINDFSIQLGKEKCLLTIGIPLELMRKKGFNLCHKDIVVLDIFVTLQSSSILVKERLDVVKSRVGTPAQVVSDYGPDIKKGNELFCLENPSVVYTYDISHKIGCLLKALLENDSTWQSLLKTVNIVLQQVQQTELSFLRPILPRKKSRYLNIGIIVNWVKNILSYQDSKDFSLVESGYTLQPESVYQIANSHSDKKLTNALLKMTRKKYQCRQDIIDDLSAMIDIIEKIQKIVKHCGLLNGTMKEIGKEIDISEFKGDKSRLIYDQIIEYLKGELSKFKDPENAYLACSDIEESLFGKYKYKLAERTGGVYSSVLLLTAFCSEFVIGHITAACEKYKMKDVDDFIKQMTGKSLQAKRRIAFSATN